MNNPRNANCDDIRRMLPDVAVSEDEGSESRLVMEHIESCEECARELFALRRTGELLDGTVVSKSPDQWEAISLRLTAREPRRAAARSWFGRYRLQSAIAFGAAVAALLGFMFTRPDTPAEIDPQVYFLSHSSMSWREPFADRAGLGLASVTPVEVEVESEN